MSTFFRQILKYIKKKCSNSLQYSFFIIFFFVVIFNFVLLFIRQIPPLIFILFAKVYNFSGLLTFSPEPSVNFRKF